MKKIIAILLASAFLAGCGIAKHSATPEAKFKIVFFAPGERPRVFFTDIYIQEDGFINFQSKMDRKVYTLSGSMAVISDEYSDRTKQNFRDHTGE